MNLQQLLSIPDLDFSIFEETMREHYGYEHGFQYKRVLQDMFMLELDPEAYTKKSYWLRVEPGDTPDDEDVYDVCLFYPNSTDKTTYACDMTPWNELLAYSVDAVIEQWVDTNQLLIEELLAHIIYEITFYGMTEEAVQEEHDKLIEILENPDLHVFEIPDNDEVLEEHEKYIPRSKRQEGDSPYAEKYAEAWKKMLEQIKKDVESGEFKNYPTHQDVFGDDDGDELNENE